MSCEYNYYDKTETYYPRLYCSVNGKPCLYSKRCEKQEKYIPIDGQKECYIFNMEQKKKIPQGSCYIIFEKKGYLFVELNDDESVKIKNTLGEIKQNYIYIKKEEDGYKISLTPFPVEVKEEKVERVNNEKKRNKTR